MNENMWLLLFIIAIEQAVIIGAVAAAVGFLKDIYKELKKK